MKNLPIVGKLSIAFGIAMAALICMGTFGIMKLGVLDDRITYMAVDQQDKQAAIAAISSDLLAYRNQLAIELLVSTPEDVRRSGEAMDAAAADISDRLRFLNGALKVSASREALAEFKAEWGKFLPQARKTRALADGNRREEAIASYRADTAAFDTARRELKELTEKQSRNRLNKLADAHATYKSARMLMIAAIVAVLALLGGLLVAMVRQIARPIAAVTTALGDLSHGKMDAVMPTGDRRDEVGALTTAMFELRDQLAAAERAKAEQTALIVDSVGAALSSLADGDLVARIEVELTGPFGKLKTDFNNAATSLHATLAQVLETATGISGGAGEIRQASDDLSQRTEQQAASLEETAAAMDEITTTVRSTAERASTANIAVDGIRHAAEHSGDVVREAMEAMAGIERGSKEISEIISVIDGIAFQTNLLALNAGVEAARAGDAGKGFAVVASEVRALAQRSADAAKDVKTRITASSVQVEAGVRFVGETGEALNGIIRRMAEVSALVAEITTAAQQQASGLQQVNIAVAEMDGVTQQNAAMVEEATAAARGLAEDADGLNRQIARFRLADGPATPASPVHELQRRAASAGRRIGKAALMGSGNAAVAASNDWSEF